MMPPEPPGRQPIESPDLADRYRRALVLWLNTPEGASLEEAYELGRDALTSGTSPLSLVAYHHEALSAVLARSACNADAHRAIATNAARFFEEVLAPYEMAMRGFTEAVRTLRRSNDLLERRVVERTRELEDAVRARDEFLAIASHELKTPITALQLEAQNAVGQAAAEAALGGAPGWIFGSARRILRSTERLTELVDVLLDVSRITSGTLQLELSELDLGAVAREVAGRFAPQAERVGSPLVLDLPLGIVGMWDRFRLEQTFANLLSNALKFGAGKPVEIAARREQELGVLEIRDHGAGIDPAERERVFGRFERAAPVRHYGGLGLGLWLCRQNVGAMGGTVELSTPAGGGTVAIVRLPRAPISGTGHGPPADRIDAG